ncbi:MAG: outer membrane protein [Sphingomonadaceae bacterium]
MKKFIVAAFMATALAAPAAAQGHGGANSGFRIEGLVGYDDLQIPDESASGIVYGAGIGYDFGTPGMQFGVEAELTDSSVDDCIRGFVLAGDELCAEAGRDIYVGGRIGTFISPGTLIYAKGGYTNAEIALRYEDGTPAIFDDFVLEDELDGFRVGGGLEFGFGPNSFGKAEYRYSNYEDDFEKHQLVAGFGFRF